MNEEAILNQRIKQMGILLLFILVFISILSLRQSRSSEWLLETPTAIDSWSISEMPLSQEVLGKLGGSNTRGIEFTNPLDEKVRCQFIAPRSFESYREPDLFSQLQISAQRSIPLFGASNPVRAWVLKVPNSEQRMLVYAWLQSPTGTTTLFGDRSMEPSFFERLRLNGSGLVRNESLCLVRLYTPIGSSDKNGAQARRTLDRIAHGIYDYNTKGKS
jgi:hypothetical protein